MKIIYPNQQKKEHYIQDLLSDIPELTVNEMLQEESDKKLDRKLLKPIVGEFIARINNIAEWCENYKAFEDVITEIKDNISPNRTQLLDSFSIKEEPKLTYCKELFLYLIGNQTLIEVNMRNKRMEIPDQEKTTFCTIISNLAQKATEEILESSQHLRRSKRLKTTPNTPNKTSNPSTLTTQTSPLRRTQEELTQSPL
jgi:hypothetical protein